MGVTKKEESRKKFSLSSSGKKIRTSQTLQGLRIDPENVKTSLSLLH